MNISDAEQRRIGQDLHDGVCQTLAALSCSATSLRGELETRNLAVEANAAAELARLLQAAVVETRDLARSLVPAHVSDVGLVVALESLVHSVSRLHGMGCTFQFRGGELDGNEIVATHFYRIAQEAISNAIKHGKARNVALLLDAGDKRLVLKVKDDGVGISENPAGHGLGLAVMRYRARLSGGELTVARLSEGGTEICCTIPTNGAEGEIFAA